MSLCKNSSIEECVTCEKKAGWHAVYANLALALFKAFVGYISGSKAILGDALFSFKDFIASLVVVIGIKVSGKPADDQHPYGHGKVEFVALFLISIGLIITTVFLFVHSVKGIWACFHGGYAAPGLVAFWAAIISVIANLKLSQYLRCVGEKLNSLSMLANAKHNLSDSVSSGMVAVAVLGAHFGGMVFLDPLVALIESVCLLAMGIEMLMEALKGLFDFAASPELAGRIESRANLVPGVRKVSKIVARQLGQGIWIDMTIKIDPSLSHQEGYIIGQHVKESLQMMLGKNTTVNLVIEPYMP